MAAAQVSQGHVAYNSIRLTFYLLDMQWSGGGGGVDHG